MYEKDRSVCMYEKDRSMCMYEKDRSMCMYEKDRSVCMYEKDKSVYMYEKDRDVFPWLLAQQQANLISGVDLLKQFQELPHLEKLKSKLAILFSHSVLTRGQPIQELTL